jgi:hypothetical protein
MVMATALARSSRRRLSVPRTAWREAVFILFAVAILLFPAWPQILGERPNPLFRSWQMYAGVGVGVLKGTFLVERSAGRETLSPLAVLGLKRYPPVMTIPLSTVPLRRPEDLGLLSKSFCASLSPDARLSFDGVVGTRNGWQLLKRQNICEGF